jgi:hypothetical protein
MTRQITEKTEQSLIRALNKTAQLINEEDLDPHEAIAKAAHEERLGPKHIQLLVQAYNIGMTNERRKTASSLIDKISDFDLVDSKNIIKLLYPDKDMSDIFADVLSKTKGSTKNHKLASIKSGAYVADRNLWLRSRSVPQRYKVAIKAGSAQKGQADNSAVIDKAIGFTKSAHNLLGPARSEVSKYAETIRENCLDLDYYFKKLGCIKPSIVLKNVLAAFGKDTAKIVKQAVCHVKTRNDMINDWSVDLSVSPYREAKAIHDALIGYKKAIDECIQGEKAINAWNSEIVKLGARRQHGGRGGGGNQGQNQDQDDEYSVSKQLISHVFAPVKSIMEAIEPYGEKIPEPIKKLKEPFVAFKEILDKGKEKGRKKRDDKDGHQPSLLGEILGHRRDEGQKIEEKPSPQEELIENINEIIDTKELSKIKSNLKSIPDVGTRVKSDTTLKVILTNLMTSDPVISEADPKEVMRIVKDIKALSNNSQIADLILNNETLLKYYIRAYLSQGRALPAYELLQLTKGWMGMGGMGPAGMLMPRAQS